MLIYIYPNLFKNSKMSLSVKDSVLRISQVRGIIYDNLLIESLVTHYTGCLALMLKNAKVRRKRNGASFL